MTKEEAIKLLANTKVYAGEKRKEVIVKLLNLGLKKISDDMNINRIEDAEFIYIFDGSTFEVGKNIYFFFEHKYRQITRSEILDIQIDSVFKDGDVLFSKSGCVFIFNGEHDEAGNLHFYIGTDCSGGLILSHIGSYFKSGVRFSTEEESDKLFNALSDAGKRWNAEKKCVEYLFKPFDKVLMKCADGFGLPWVCCLYSHKQGNLYCSCGGTSYPECIPYAGNEHLLGTK